MSFTCKLMTMVAALTALYAPAQDFKADHPNYVLLNIGAQSFSNDAAFFSQALLNRFDGTAAATTIDLDTSDFSVGITEGYHFNKWVGMEGTLAWSGDQDVRVTTVENVGEDTVVNTYSMTSEFYSFQLAGMFTWHFKPWLFAYGKAGANAWRINHNDLTGTTIRNTLNDNRQSFSPVLGGGVQALFNDQYAVKLSWDKTEVDDLKVSTVSFGVGFIF